MNGCKKEQFELQKVKILKAGTGVEIDFNVRHNEDGVQTVDRYTKETTTFPHPDLTAAVGRLRKYLALSVGKETIFSDGVIESYESSFKKDEMKTFLKDIQERYNSELNKITVTGLSVSGLDNNKGVIITGTYQCKNGAKIAVNSPRIRFASEIMGFESELEELCNIIESEAYLYTFEGKQAQAEIIFDEKN